MRFAFFALCALSIALPRTVVSAADLDLIVYGATGCVGHIAAGHLAQQPGLKWGIAARNLTELNALQAKLEAAGGQSSKPEIIVSSLSATADLSWVRRAKAVVTAAGPFSIHGGEFLVKACAENGVHYSDTSDEFYWQRWMVDRHDAAAQKSGARIVLSSGFCALAGDLGSQLALESLGDAGKSSSEEVSLDAWLEEYNGGLSAGVINTGKAIKNASYPKEWDADPYVLAPSADASLRVDKKVEGMGYPTWVHGEGFMVSNIFGPYDARLLRRSFVERSQKVQLRVGALPSVYTKWAAFLALHPGSWSSLLKCPAEPVLEGGSWSYRFNAKAGTTSKTVLLSGAGDPGYKFTAFGLAEAGLCLAGKTAGCLRSSGSGGVYTSMSAMNADALRQRLESVGLLKVSVSSDSTQVEQSDAVVV